MTSDRERRLGLNQAVFREVNEQIADQVERIRLSQALLDLVCECSQVDCVQRLEVSRAGYEAVRAHPNRFLVHPGHAARDLEEIVEAHRGYHVIEKHPGVPSDVAEATDRRSQ